MSSFFQNRLKNGNVIPLYMETILSERSNYRPIWKFENYTAQRLNTCISKNKILFNSQFGFRTRFSTSDALLYTTESTEFICTEKDKDYKMPRIFSMYTKPLFLYWNILLEKLSEIEFH